jgi:hypothetical protein
VTKDEAEATNYSAKKIPSNAREFYVCSSMPDKLPLFQAQGNQRFRLGLNAACCKKNKK